MIDILDPDQLSTSFFGEEEEALPRYGCTICEIGKKKKKCCKKYKKGKSACKSCPKK